ncbi:MAG TPA: hypothetical protein VMV29_04980 [Ktedonobacterales bacterium]|nr:hypothetical protein [Ktedonobacterales bacterium]
MERDAEKPPSMLCPLCEQRLPDTTVSYDEAVTSNTTVSDTGPDLNTIISHSGYIDGGGLKYTSTAYRADGDLKVCAECAARYNRSLTLRARSRPLLNWGIVALVVSIVVTILTIKPNGSPWEALALAPLLVGVALFLVSIGIRIIGDRLARPMKRYLLGKRARVPA